MSVRFHMGKFIIRAATGRVDDTVRERLRVADRVAVLEETPRMLLVEAESESDLHSAVDLSNLLVVPERAFAPPDTRPKVR